MYMRMSRSREKVGEENGVRKGYVPLMVGSEEVMERIMVPTKLIDHPYIIELLELSAKEYGYNHQGLLKIQYDAHSFKTMMLKMTHKAMHLISITMRIRLFMPKPISFLSILDCPSYSPKMALPSSALSSHYLGSSNEIEELEIDEALLRDLLEEETNEECSVQSLDVNNYDSPSKINGKDDLDWQDMMNEAPSLAMDEIMVWYIDDMFDYAAYTGDYSQFYNECFSDETNYCCLWQA
ncbi:hypothetical protein EZV62_019791 [Acer yangbiense]|uniref:Auxin-responsive protein n=1 Tax=Acer yangbiense TaxID=1000413 RepID=A0A5C7HD56_9ROSI|nr:hypothetical protein EZV62_019791 [Acer yangbiense]